MSAFAPLCPNYAHPGRLHTFHRRANRVGLRMDVAPGHREIAVPREIRERVRVHVCRPARQARVTECLERERLDFGEQAGAFVLLLGRGLLRACPPAV